MSAAEFSALLLLFAAATFTPGPNTTLSTALAANRGLRGALHFICAVPAGWVLLLLLCGAGLGALVLAAPPLRWAILLVGVAYMLWLAARLARSGTLGQADARQLDVSFVEGVGLQFLNIKVWLLALTAVAGWVVGHPDWITRLGWTGVLMVVFGLASNFTYALVGSLLRGALAHAGQARAGGQQAVADAAGKALGQLLGQGVGGGAQQHGRRCSVWLRRTIQLLICTRQLY